MNSSRPLTLLLCILFLTGLISGQLLKKTESDWIDVVGKPDDEIREILSEYKDLKPILPKKLAIKERKVINDEQERETNYDRRKAGLTDRLNAAQQASNHQDQTVHLLTEAIGKASSRIKALNNQITDLDSLNRQSQGSIDAERERIKKRVLEFAFYTVGIGRAPNIGKPAAIRELINSQVVRQAIETANGVQIIRKTVIENGLLKESWIQTVISGKANQSLRGSMAPDPDDPVNFYVYQYGIIDVYPLQKGKLDPNVPSKIALQDVEVEIVTSIDDGLAVNLPEKEKEFLLADLEKAKLKNETSSGQLNTAKDLALEIINTWKDAIRINENAISEHHRDLDSTRRELKQRKKDLKQALKEQIKKAREHESLKEDYTAHLANNERLKIITRKGRQGELKVPETFEKLILNTFDEFNSFATTYSSEETLVLPATGALSQDKQSKLAKALLREIKILSLAKKFDPVQGDVELSATVVYRFGFEYELAPLEATLQLGSEPSGAKVKIDGVFKGMTPLKLTMEPGHYELNISLEGYHPWTKSLELIADSTDSISAVLAPIVVTATVILNSRPSGARVTVNGEYSGSTPLTVTLKPDRYEIRISKVGYETWQEAVTITADGPNKYSPVLAPIVEPAAATIILDSQPRNARVTVNGEYFGSTPLTATLKPDRYEIRISKEGYETWQEAVTITADGPNKYSPVLPPVVESTIAKIATIILSSQPRNARVTINGEDYGRTPLEIVLPPGWYEIGIGKEGYKDWMKLVNITAGQVKKLSATLEKKKKAEIETIRIPKRKR